MCSSDLSKDKADVDLATNSLETELRGEADKEFDKNLDFINFQLKAELLGAVLGEDTRTSFELKNDSQAQEACRYLADNRLFAKAFKKAKDKG